MKYMEENNEGNQFGSLFRPKQISKIFSYEFTRAFKQKKYYAVIIVGLLFQILYLSIAKIYPEIESLPGFEHSHMAIQTVLFPTGFFTLIISLAVAFNSISGEFENGSAKLLFTKPLSKIEFYIGKFLGSFGAVAVAILVWVAAGLSGYVIYGSQTLLGNVPFVFLALIYAALPFLAIIAAVSAITKKSTVSAVIVLGIYFVQTMALIPILQYIYSIDIVKFLPNWGIENFPMTIAGINPSLSNDAFLAAISIAIYTLIPFIAGLIYFKYSDITE